VLFSSSSSRSSRRPAAARFGQHHFARGTVKQPDAGLMFQLFHAVADRRLAQANHLPCPAKAFGMATVTKIQLAENNSSFIHEWMQ
jgi:hypothetical protein